MKCLENVGMLSTTPILFEGHEIVPIQFLKALLPDPASLQYLHHNCDVDVQCRLPVLSSSGQAFFAIVATNSFLLFFV